MFIQLCWIDCYDACGVSGEGLGLIVKNWGLIGLCPNPKSDIGAFEARGSRRAFTTSTRCSIESNTRGAIFSSVMCKIYR